MTRKTRSACWPRMMLPVLAVSVLPAGSFAQAEEPLLEEILVTATRRAATDIQTTPIAVTAVTAEDIAQLVPRDLGDIAVNVPNFVSGKTPGFNSANFAIRGAGSNGIILYFDPQVGVTVDDFVIPHIQTQNIEMLDIERVEVLRGPQGTLFGKNTTGGVVNVRTMRPDLEAASLDLQAKVAEHGRTEGQFMVNVPLHETLAFRGTGLYMESDGYYENGAAYGPVSDFGVGSPLAGTSGQGDGDDIGGDDVLSGRFKLRWQPTDRLDVNLAYEIVRDEGDAPPSVNGTPPGTGYLWNLLGLTRDPGDQIDVAASTQRDDLLLKMSDGHQVDVDGYYLNWDFDISEQYTLTGLLGYRETDSYLPSTYTGEVGPNSLFDATRQDERETTQFEVRISTQYAGPFNGLVGFFYQEDETVFTVSQVLGFVDLVNPTGGLFDANPQVLSNAQDAESWAVFVDGTYDINDQWSVGGGFRWTYEEKEWTGRNQVFIQDLPGFFDPTLTWEVLGEPLRAANFGLWPTGVVESDEDWDEPTWRLTASYAPSEDVYTYFTYARGFKSGGYNDQTGTGGLPIEPLQAAPTDPEKADSFELGVRSDLADGRLRLNGTLFYVTYDDSQQQILATIPADRDGDGDPESSFQETRFFNAAEIDAWGVELESTYLITDGLTVRANVGYLDSEFDEFQADTNFDGEIDTDLSNNDVARAPEWTWGIDVMYDHSFLGGTLSWFGNVNYEDDAVWSYTSLPDTPDGVTDDRTLVNAAITFNSGDDRWWVRAYGKNLTDEEYRIGELPVANLWVMSFYGEPRTLGIEGGIRFGW